MFLCLVAAHEPAGDLTLPHSFSTENLSHSNDPKERFLRLSAVRERVPYSRSPSTGCALGENSPSLPSCAGAVAWLEREIDAWIQAQIERSRNLQPQPKAAPAQQPAKAAR